jgi:hypothetical protein
MKHLHSLGIVMGRTGQTCCGKRVKLFDFALTEDADCPACRTHAERYARAIGYALDTDNPGPTGLGADVDVTIQPTKKPGAVHVWCSRGYYFAEGATE